MYRAREKQMSIYDYLPPYHGELCNANRWVRLADAIDWPGGFYRRDIGWRAL